MQTVPAPGQPDWGLVAESIPHMVWLAAPDGSTEYVNRRTTDYTGRPADAHSGWDWVGLIHPDDADRARDSWQSAVSAGAVYDAEFRIRRFDGAYRWHALRASPMRGDDNEIQRWIGTATDIEVPRRLETSLVEAEGAAEESGALLVALQAAAPVGLGFVDRDLCLVQANDEFAGIGGKFARGHIGNKIADALPSLWPQIEAGCRRVLDTGSTVRNLAVIGTATDDPGQVHEWLASCYPVESDQEVIGVGIVAVDVTELSQATEFRSAVMSQVADGVYAEDSDGNLVFMNRAASKMLGWSEEELRGRSMHDAIHYQRADGTPVALTDCAIVAAGAEGRIGRGVGEAFTRKDGSIFPIAYSAVPLRIGSHIDGVVVVFHEIPEPGVAPRAIRLLIVDSHVMVSEAFQLLLGTQEGIEVVGTAATSADALDDVARLEPDVVLIDVDLPDVDGVATARLITAAAPDASTILVTQSYDDEVVRAAVEAGCAGVLDKDRAFVELVGAVRAAFYGQTILSPRDLRRVLPDKAAKAREGMALLTNREQEVLSCISEGLSNRAVAERLGVTANTVRNHVQRILYKLNVHSKLEAIVFARQDPTGSP